MSLALCFLIKLLLEINNISKMLLKAKGMIEYVNGKFELKVNSKVVIAVMESSSYEEDETIQDMWACL